MVAKVFSAKLIIVSILVVLILYSMGSSSLFSKQITTEKSVLVKEEVVVQSAGRAGFLISKDEGEPSENPMRYVEKKVNKTENVSLLAYWFRNLN